MTAGRLADWDTEPITPDPVISLVFDPASGRMKLPHGLQLNETLEITRHHYGQFYDVGAGTHDRSQYLMESPTNIAHSGFAMPASTAPDAGIYEFVDSQTYAQSGSTGITANENLYIQAADGARPYIKFEDVNVGNWRISSSGNVKELVCLLYTSPSPRDRTRSRMPSSA